MMNSKRIFFVVGLVAIVGIRVFGDVPSTRPAKEFYIGGEIARPGVYAISENELSVIKAVEAAGIKNEEGDCEVKIIQRFGTHKLERITVFTSLNALMELPEAAINLSPGDMVQVKAIKR